MALLLKNGALFLHVPKTGGNWVTQVLDEQRLIQRSIGPKHSDMVRSLNPLRFRRGRKWWSCAARQTFGRLIPGRIKPSGFRFCFVRDPLTWYESFWKYQSARNWPRWGDDDEFAVGQWHPNAMLNDAADGDFNAFVRKVIQKRPGYVTELYSWYTQPKIEFVGYTEHLADDLIRVLKILRHEFDEADIRSNLPVNVSRAPQPIHWNPELRAEVERQEYAGRLRYGYARSPLAAAGRAVA